MSKIHSTFIVLFISLMFLSCDDSSNSILTTPDGYVPVVTGLRINVYDNMSPVVVSYADWRTPNTEYWDFILYYGDKKSPYVTRSNDSIIQFIQLSISPRNSFVQLYFIRARLPEENPSYNISGSTINVDFTTSAYMVVNEHLQSGSYMFAITKRMLNELGPGFYRLYLKTEYYSEARSCVVFKDRTDIPSDLYDLIMKLYKYE